MNKSTPKSRYYSDPYKEKSFWYINEFNAEGVRTNKHEFSKRSLAVGFLNTINIYVDEELVYSGE